MGTSKNACEVAPFYGHAVERKACGGTVAGSCGRYMREVNGAFQPIIRDHDS
ncbi:hypothetical protein [Ferrithrix thermotolerans]|uniref:hypothetical protein n=1 Tax=Ferrithrix thermotolerans TaxID=209649 RepID=UPI0015BF4945|nr:hypothetical protein [Ferrithrix thermotolerans]